MGTTKVGDDKPRKCPIVLSINIYITYISGMHVSMYLTKRALQHDENEEQLEMTRKTCPHGIEFKNLQIIS